MCVPNLDLCALLWFVDAFDPHSVRLQVEKVRSLVLAMHRRAISPWIAKCVRSETVTAKEILVSAH